MIQESLTFFGLKGDIFELNSRMELTHRRFLLLQSLEHFDHLMIRLLALDLPLVILRCFVTLGLLL